MVNPFEFLSVLGPSSGPKNSIKVTHFFSHFCRRSLSKRNSGSQFKWPIKSHRSPDSLLIYTRRQIRSHIQRIGLGSVSRVKTPPSSTQRPHLPILLTCESGTVESPSLLLSILLY